VDGTPQARAAGAWHYAPHLHGFGACCMEHRSGGYAVGPGSYLVEVDYEYVVVFFTVSLCLKYHAKFLYLPILF
jgi:hypothetical protein